MLNNTFKNARTPEWLKISKAFETILCIFLFSLIILPVSRNEFRIGFIILMSVLTINKIQTVKVSSSIFSAFIFSIFVGTFFVASGFFNDNPGVGFVAPVYVLLPVFYFLIFVSYIKNIMNVVKVMKIVLYGTIFIGILAIYFALQGYFGLPDPLNLLETFASPILFPDGSYRTVDFSAGVPKMRLYSISSLVYTAPFLVTLFFIKREYVEKFFSMRLVYTATALALTGVLLTGRRALILNVFLIPFLVYFYGYFSKIKSINIKLFNYLIAVSILILVSFVLIQNQEGQTNADTNVESYSDYFLRAFDSGEADGAYERLTQTNALLRGWWDSFWLGNGFGGFTNEVVRSDRGRVWEYESQYALLLFSAGIIGFLCYLTITLWLIRSLFKFSAKSTDLSVLILPNTCGLISFLVANATNPYLQAYGHLWVIFFPVAILNMVIISEKYRFE